MPILLWMFVTAVVKGAGTAVGFAAVFLILSYHGLLPHRTWSVRDVVAAVHVIRSIPDLNACVAALRAAPSGTVVPACEVAEG